MKRPLAQNTEGQERGGKGGERAMPREERIIRGLTLLSQRI